MIKHPHGGTGWLDGIDTDLSASVNACPLPEAVLNAAREAALKMNRYPDPEYQALREAIGALEGADPDLIVCGNGASELFTAIVRAFSPRRIGLFDPCYSGYERACGGIEQERFTLSPEDGFCLGEAACSFVREADIDMLFLADPNNPTGRLIPPAVKTDILGICRERGITAVLDECFIDLTSRGKTGAADREASEVQPFGGLLRIKAFTKIFAVPGARIGYVVCGSREAADRIRQALPEWNLSVFSEAVGITCAGIQKTTDYAADSLKRNAAERARLTECLTGLGFTVFPSDTNFILIRVPAGSDGLKFLEELASEHGILLRSCANFRGLDSSYIRISVGKPGDNDKLMAAVRGIFARTNA